ncbi:MAG: cyclase family protein [Saprospiraceae bacterium]|nr:cyclase family protein [Saprospiraceae bacterium]
MTIFDANEYNLHDLTRTYSTKVAGYSDSIAKDLDRDGWNAKWLNMYSHAGTHMDAPHHFGITPQTIDQLPLASFMGKAHMVRLHDVSEKQIITIADLGSVSSRFQAGDSLLIRTDWSKKFGKSSYRNMLPRIGSELANWCVEKKVKILGVEPPSVADVNDMTEVTEIHRILLGGNVIIIEGLINLDQIKRDDIFIMALPIKIKNGDGAPARVIAFEKK